MFEKVLPAGLAGENLLPTMISASSLARALEAVGLTAAATVTALAIVPVTELLVAWRSSVACSTEGGAP